MQSFKRFLLRWIIFPIKRRYWSLSSSVRSAVKVVIVRDGKILLVRQSFGPNFWTLPGGGVDQDELLEDAARREVQEEVGLTLENILLCGEFMHPAKNRNTIFTATTSGEPSVADSVEIVEVRWFDPRQLPTNISPRLIDALKIAQLL